MSINVVLLAKVYIDKVHWTKYMSVSEICKSNANYLLNINFMDLLFQLLVPTKIVAFKRPSGDFKRIPLYNIPTS